MSAFAMKAACMHKVKINSVTVPRIIAHQDSSPCDLQTMTRTCYEIIRELLGHLSDLSRGVAELRPLFAMPGSEDGRKYRLITQILSAAMTRTISACRPVGLLQRVEKVAVTVRLNSSEHQVRVSGESNGHHNCKYY